MSTYLILNLRRLGDVISTSHLIHSIKSNEPDAKIALLIYDETFKAASSLEGIDQIFQISRQQIISLRKNKLFTNAFALNKFEEELQTIRSQKWDHVINYSNDKVSSYLTTYLQKHKSKVHGISFVNNVVQNSNDWSIIFNDVLTTYAYPSVHFQDCYHNLINIKGSLTNKTTKVSSSHEKTCKENFDHIKKIQDNKKIIAIQLCASTQTKSLPYETYIELTEQILESKTYYPVFLIAPVPEEREMMEKINKEFGGSLVSIETDFLALASVLKNIDLLVTPDTSVKHHADANAVPLVEIALGEAPFAKQGTTTRGNIIITFANKAFNSRYCPNSKEILNQNKRLKASDILNAIDYYFLKVDKKYLRQNTNSEISIYEVSYDQKGLVYRLINKETDLIDMKRKASREILYRMTTEGLSDNYFFKQIEDFDSKLLTELITKEKQEITSVMKSLLACLRSVVKKSSTEIPKALFKNLDALLVSADSHFFSALPVIIFSSEIESLSDRDPISGISQIETLLYKLKNNLQIILAFLKEIEISSKEDINNKKIREFQNKRVEDTPVNKGSINEHIR